MSPKLNCNQDQKKQLLIICTRKKKQAARAKNLLYTNKLEMANYFCPNIYLSVENQRQIFEITKTDMSSKLKYYKKFNVTKNYM